MSPTAAAFTNCGSIYQPRQHSPTVAAFSNRGSIYQPWQHLPIVAAFTNKGTVAAFTNRASIYPPWQHLPIVAAFVEGALGCLLSSVLARHIYRPCINTYPSFLLTLEPLRHMTELQEHTTDTGTLEKHPFVQNRKTN